MPDLYVIPGGIEDLDARAPIGFRTPPHNIDAEQALLGAILINNEAYERVQHFLLPEHFYEPVHGRIFAAMKRLIDDGKIADHVTLKVAFDEDEALKELDGSRYLSRMARAAETVLNAPDYARHIVDLASKRAAIRVGEELVNSCYAPGLAPDWPDLVALARMGLEQIEREGQSCAGWLTLQDVAERIAAQVEAPPRHMPTGLMRLDDDLGGGLLGGRVYVFEGQAKSQKSQPVDEPVLLADGTWKPIGQLRIGDRLASIDGAPSRVVGVYPQGQRPVCRITTSDGRWTRADVGHLWAVKDHWTGGWRVVETRNLLDRRRPTLPRVSGHFGQARELPVEPYLLGVLIGDGGLSDDRRIRFSTADAEILQAVGDALPPSMHVAHEANYDYRVAGRGGGCWRRAGTGSPLLGRLRALGLMGCRSHEKFVPEVYFAASRSDRLALLQGLLDTDGSAKAGYVVFSTTSLQLADDVVRLARSLGMVAKRRQWAGSGGYAVNGERRVARPSYVVFIRADTPQDLCRLSRKKARLLAKRRKGVQLNVVKVEPIGEAECVCIKVSHPSQLYITRDYIVTHNTGVLATIARHQIRNGVPFAYIMADRTIEEAVGRILAAELRTNARAFERANDPALAGQVRAIGAQLDKGNVMLAQEPALTFERLKALGTHAAEAGAKGIVLDYFQRVGEATTSDRESRAQGLEYVAEWIKSHAIRYDCWWALGSQENDEGKTLGSRALQRAAVWLGKLRAVEIERISDKRTGIYMEIAYRTHGTAAAIGDKDNPAWIVDEYGPLLEPYIPLYSDRVSAITPKTTNPNQKKGKP